ncbi:MAG: AAA family ATPase [Clostridiales bacterium]|nr:AAA family ATPase [Clostridiales bacterium]
MSLLKIDDGVLFGDEAKEYLRFRAAENEARADLVGKYVGWTAVQVRQAFDRASGSVLFIDEAYSLLDNSQTFGDEAINTIVQEMENRREDVVVIFAGAVTEKEAVALTADDFEGLRLSETNKLDGRIGFV